MTRLARWRARANWPELLRDGHVYGGALLAAVGLWFIRPAVAAVAFGAFLVYLGLRRPPWRGPAR